MRMLATLLMLLLATTVTRADEVYVPDPSANVGTNNSIPFHAEWSPIAGAIRYQALYTAAQLGNQPFQVRDIAFAPMYTGTFTATQFQLRVSHTSATSLAALLDQNLPNPTTLYDGPLTYPIVTDQWSALGLQGMFAYDGTGNLVVDLRYMGGVNTVASGSFGKFRYVNNAIPRNWAYNNYNATTRSGTDTTAGLKTRFTVDRTSITGSGNPTPGAAVDFALLAPADAGLPYQVGTSLGDGPTPIDTRTIGLSLDDLLVVSTSKLWPAVFTGYAGLLDAQGQAKARMNIPNLPALKGIRLHTAFVTLWASAPSGIQSISNTFTFTIL
ncbi:MAG: hypothetical protein JXQ29_05120 [Planctomycetes bacterium]|nr:hypothetical protein [Planctomycetota bacterium]